MRSKNFEDKIINLADFAIDAYQDSINLVLTTGAFDMLHPGHVRYLWRASEQGDYLIVGIDSDKRVRSAKGEHRPFFHEKDRSIVVAGLGFVDLVCVFDNMKELLDTVLPTTLVVSPTSTEDASFDRKMYAKNRGIKIVEISEQAKMHTSDFAKQIRYKILESD